MKKTLLFLWALFLWAAPLRSQHYLADSVRMQWFRDARLGIFIHWGIYSVKGVGESWSFYNGHISYDDYMSQLQGFTAARYRPGQWAALIKQTGARYAVITAKHHDGVALWDSRYDDLNVVKKSPAGRDVLAPFVQALRRDSIKVGLYYSLLDWSHPDYPNFTKKKKRYQGDTARWERFVRYNFNQIGELMGRYHPDLMWFDGDWEQSAERWHAPQIRELLLQKNPAVVINSRLRGYGDYATPEQGVPVRRPGNPYWELCMTTNTSWGYQPRDTNYKTTGQIIAIFADVISLGGNLLLDIGPKADGTIPQEQERLLRELGQWVVPHSEAVFGTRAGIPRDYFAGPSTLSADSTVLYLFVPGKPTLPLMVKGLANKVKRVRPVGSDKELSWQIKMKLPWSAAPGLLFIDLPASLADDMMSVIAVELDGPVKLYNSVGVH